MPKLKYPHIKLLNRTIDGAEVIEPVYGLRPGRPYNRIIVDGAIATFSPGDERAAKAYGRKYAKAAKNWK